MTQLRLRQGDWPLALVALLLASCNIEGSVAVTGDPMRPIFVATFDQGKAACIDSISVSLAGETSPKYVWGVRRLDRSNDRSCVDRIAFGIVPTGYEVSFPLAPLAKGQAYDVSAQGVSWSAKANWTP